MVDLTDPPDPSNAPDNPGGFLSDSFMFMFMVGFAVALLQLGRRYIANPIVGGAESVVNGVQNTAEETSTEDPIEVF
jgi:hypothetical protein